MADDSDAEKTEDPSAHKLEESRRKGEVASSKELTSVLVLSASVLTLGLSFVFIFEEMESFVLWLAHLDISKAYTEKSLRTIAYRTAKTAIICAAPVSLAALCMGIVANVLQVGLLFAPEVLELKPERINPLSGIKRLFTMKSVVEAIKGIFKFTIVIFIVYQFMKDDITSYVGYLHMDFFSAFIHGKASLINLGFSIIGGLLIVAIGDFAFQKYSHMQKLKMTKEEAKKEAKEQDGNPEVKQRIRAIQREQSQNRMMSEIPTADVIITNPTHISIILKYDTIAMVSPTVIGKGADNVAMRIREIAKEHDIPIVENVPLARALFKTVAIGEAVPRTLYKTVAEVLAFVYKLKKKKNAIM